MNRISILDCTLRDGGYVNDFLFGKRIITDMIDKLSKASIDIIECGFLQSGANDPDRSLFGNLKQIESVITSKNPNSIYVAMIQYGKISAEEIEYFTGKSIDGIRVTFHEHEIADAFVLGRVLIEKGYKVFMQPVGTTTYTDEALLQLIRQVNELTPYAFYIVDTLGTMYKNDVLRMFYLVEHNLNKNIAIGFHSHNNLQLSFSNAQELMQIHTDRQLIIDASVFGMGRGAGNLNTELVTQYINTSMSLKYDNIQILEIMDEYIKPLSIKYKWGYDAAYYLASVNGCHPNYASFLLNAQTLSIKDISLILLNLPVDKRALFDKALIQEAYINYMNHRVDDAAVRDKIGKLTEGRNVLVLAPGKSLRDKTDEINTMISSGDYFVVSVNFLPKDIKVDMVFASNIKRFKNLNDLMEQVDCETKIVVTSNITTSSKNNLMVIDYSSYNNEEQIIIDNAGLMCINFLRRIGVPSVVLAGFDGFSSDIKNNYYNDSMLLDVEAEHLLAMNTAIADKLSQLMQQIDIKFLYTSEYQKRG